MQQVMAEGGHSAIFNLVTEVFEVFLRMIGIVLNDHVAAVKPIQSQGRHLV